MEENVLSEEGNDGAQAESAARVVWPLPCSLSTILAWNCRLRAESLFHRLHTHFRAGAESATLCRQQEGEHYSSMEARTLSFDEYFLDRRREPVHPIHVVTSEPILHLRFPQTACDPEADSDVYFDFDIVSPEGDDTPKKQRCESEKTESGCATSVASPVMLSDECQLVPPFNTPMECHESFASSPNSNLRAVRDILSSSFLENKVTEDDSQCQIVEADCCYVPLGKTRSFEIHKPKKRRSRSKRSVSLDIDSPVTRGPEGNVKKAGRTRRGKRKKRCIDDQPKSKSLISSESQETLYDDQCPFPAPSHMKSGYESIFVELHYDQKTNQYSSSLVSLGSPRKGGVQKDANSQEEIKVTDSNGGNGTQHSNLGDVVFGEEPRCAISEEDPCCYAHSTCSSEDRKHSSRESGYCVESSSECEQECVGCPDRDEIELRNDEFSMPESGDQENVSTIERDTFNCMCYINQQIPNEELDKRKEINSTQTYDTSTEMSGSPLEQECCVKSVDYLPSDTLEYDSSKSVYLSSLNSTSTGEASATCIKEEERQAYSGSNNSFLEENHAESETLCDDFCSHDVITETYNEGMHQDIPGESAAVTEDQGNDNGVDSNTDVSLGQGSKLDEQLNNGNQLPEILLYNKGTECPNIEECDSQLKENDFVSQEQNEISIHTKFNSVSTQENQERHSECESLLLANNSSLSCELNYSPLFYNVKNEELNDRSVPLTLDQNTDSIVSMLQLTESDLSLFDSLDCASEERQTCGGSALQIDSEFINNLALIDGCDLFDEKVSPVKEELGFAADKNEENLSFAFISKSSRTCMCSEELFLCDIHLEAHLAKCNSISQDEQSSSTWPDFERELLCTSDEDSLLFSGTENDFSSKNINKFDFDSSHESGEQKLENLLGLSFDDDVDDVKLPDDIHSKNLDDHYLHEGNKIDESTLNLITNCAAGSDEENIEVLNSPTVQSPDIIFDLELDSGDDKISAKCNKESISDNDSKEEQSVEPNSDIPDEISTVVTHDNHNECTYQLNMEEAISCNDCSTENSSQITSSIFYVANSSSWEVGSYVVDHSAPPGEINEDDSLNNKNNNNEFVEKSYSDNLAEDVENVTRQPFSKEELEAYSCEKEPLSSGNIAPQKEISEKEGKNSEEIICDENKLCDYRNDDDNNMNSGDSRINKGISQHDDNVKLNLSSNEKTDQKEVFLHQDEKKKEEVCLPKSTKTVELEGACEISLGEVPSNFGEMLSANKENEDHKGIPIPFERGASRDSNEEVFNSNWYTSSYYDSICFSPTSLLSAPVSTLYDQDYFDSSGVNGTLSDACVSSDSGAPRAVPSQTINESSRNVGHNTPENGQESHGVPVCLRMSEWSQQVTPSSSEVPKISQSASCDSKCVASQHKESVYRNDNGAIGSGTQEAVQGHSRSEKDALLNGTSNMHDENCKEDGHRNLTSSIEAPMSSIKTDEKSESASSQSLPACPSAATASNNEAHSECLDNDEEDEAELEEKFRNLRKVVETISRLSDDDDDGDKVAPPSEIIFLNNSQLPEQEESCQDEHTEVSSAELSSHLMQLEVQPPSDQSRSSSEEKESVKEEYKMRIKRSSSLKCGKTPPGTPGRKKIVRFADVLGLDLADVRTFLDGIPNVPKSAFTDLEIEKESAGGADLGPFLHFSAPPVPRKVLTPLFQQPGSLAGFIERVRSQKVVLEQVTMGDDLSVKGVVRVLNIDFYKSVTVRYTFDNWRNCHEASTSYIKDSCDGLTDKFSFILWGNFLQDNSSMMFCICYHAKGEEYWDNNWGSNYILQCYSSPHGASASSHASKSIHHQQQRSAHHSYEPFKESEPAHAPIDPWASGFF